MARTSGVWTQSANRVEKPEDDEKQRIIAACEYLLETFYRPKFLPEIRPTKWNYVVEINGRWSGRRYTFIQRYRSGMDDNTGEEFDAPFARIDRMGADRFDLMWYRHTGRWWRLHSGLTFADALHTLKSDGILHPH